VLLWLLYSAFAETFGAFGRINFSPRLRWLLNLLEARAVTGPTNFFGQGSRRFFHCDSIIKTDFVRAKMAGSPDGTAKLAS
jgi:hypothetical protein